MWCIYIYVYFSNIYFSPKQKNTHIYTWQKKKRSLLAKHERKIFRKKNPQKPQAAQINGPPWVPPSLNKCHTWGGLGIQRWMVGDGNWIFCFPGHL